MAKRLIKAVKFGNCRVTIHKDSEYGEYSYTPYVDGRPWGKTKESATGFTDDKQDARNTAASLIRRMRKLKLCKR